jgi:Raf kinase inhibitor-like YbhB/YbcL family protein
MNLLILLALLAPKGLTVTSSAFISNGNIPIQFTCEGKGVNPPITISDIPTAAKSLAIIVEDPDATKGTFDHWVVWNITPTSVIPENSVPGIEGKNGENTVGYKGPCPPDGRHHYIFTVYALDKMLDLKKGADKHAVKVAMKGHVLATGELVGLYEKRHVQE